MDSTFMSNHRKKKKGTKISLLKMSACNNVLNIFKNKGFYFLILVTFIFFLPILTKEQTTNSKPNVIFIYADDLGRGMLSCYGQKIVRTPNIDRLAAEGIRFENNYGAHFCAPARASFLTGYGDYKTDKWTLTEAGIYEKIYDKQFTLTQVDAKLDSIIGKEPPVMYLPQVFKKAGYVTGEVGKLEWGFSTSRRQMKDHGWDYYFGYLDHNRCHGFYPSFLFENGNLINIPGNTEPMAGMNDEKETPEADKGRWNRVGKEVYSEDLFMSKILSFIIKNKDKPFFLYFPSQLPHGPVAIPAIDPAFALNGSLSETEKEYASMVTRLDADVGKILNELKRLGIEKNTMVVFSSDNGHELYYSKAGVVDKPYRNIVTGKGFNNVTSKFYSGIGGDVFDGNNGMAGLKRSNWEGGVRVPLIIRWPGKIKSEITSHTLVSNFDFIATVADMLHVKMPDKKDAVSYLPILLGNPFNKGHEFVVYSSFMGPAMVTKTGWKLRYFAPKRIFQLYYLPDDYREEHNIIQKHLQKADSLKAIMLKECDGNLNNGWFGNGPRLVPWE